MNRKLNIFVVMPFDSEFDVVYQELIKTPLVEKGHNVNRTDDVLTHQNILEAIIQGIWNADLIIADLTGKNANVYYELGIAHALLKPTIQIAQSLADVPFDLRYYNVELYSINSDGSPKLANRVLNNIERDNFKFSNPVSQFINTDSKHIITIPRSSDDGVDDNKDIALDDSDYGLLDARADAEKAMGEIGSITKEITLDISEIGEKMRIRNKEANKLKSNPNQQRLHSKLRRVLQQFALDLDEFSDNVNQKTPALKEAWVRLDQGLGHVLLVSSIENQSDLEAALSLREEMDDLRDKESDAIKSTESFRDSQERLIGISRVSDRAVRNSVKTIDRLRDEFELGKSVLTRLIDLATNMIKRYNGDDSA